MNASENPTSTGRPIFEAITAAAWMLAVMGILFVLIATASATMGLSLLIGLGLSALIGQYVRRQILQGPGPDAQLPASMETQDHGVGWRDTPNTTPTAGDFLRQSASCIFGFCGLVLVLSPLAIAIPPIALILPIWVFITGLGAWRTLKATERRDSTALWFGYAWGLLLLGSTLAALAVSLGGSMLS